MKRSFASCQILILASSLPTHSFTLPSHHQEVTHPQICTACPTFKLLLKAEFVGICSMSLAFLPSLPSLPPSIFTYHLPANLHGLPEVQAAEGRVRRDLQQPCGVH